MIYFFLAFFYGKFLFYSRNQTVSIFYIQMLYLLSTYFSFSPNAYMYEKYPGAETI